MNIQVTMTEAEFDAYRKHRDENGLDLVKLRDSLIRRLATLITDNLHVRGIFTSDYRQTAEVKCACDLVRKEIDDLFRAAGVKL